MAENKIDFDALSNIAHGPDGGIAKLNELWGHTFQLKEWLFINRGTLTAPSPYVASRADVCEGKQLIRAFTDAQKLMDFVSENKLANNGDVPFILSVPTQDIIPWLLNFTRQQVYGIWFNSNLKSNGYYSPLAQLRPIKDHLDRNWFRR